MYLKVVTSLLISFMIMNTYSQDKKAFVWPNGAKAALCLTYDDGLSSHVTTVVPMLAKYNFQATFYPSLSSVSIRNEMDKWKAVTKAGHELGNHTVYHPCRKSKKGMEWVKEHFDLDKYSVAQIVDEINLANNFLLALDAKTERTFAYPCAHFKAGGESYKESLFELVTAARGSSEAIAPLISPQEIDLYNVPSWAPNQNSASELITYIDQIIEKGTLSTFTFHGIGAEYMRVSTSDHQEMLQYLDKHRDKIWVTTFQEATNYIKAQREK